MEKRNICRIWLCPFQIIFAGGYERPPRYLTVDIQRTIECVCFIKAHFFFLFGLVILNLSSSQSSSSSVFICLEAIHLVKASLLSVTLQCSLSHHQSNTLCCIVLHCVTLCYTVLHCVSLCYPSMQPLSPSVQYSAKMHCVCVL